MSPHSHRLQINGIDSDEGGNKNDTGREKGKFFYGDVFFVSYFSGKSEEQSSQVWQHDSRRFSAERYFPTHADITPIPSSCREHHGGGSWEPQQTGIFFDSNGPQCSRAREDERQHCINHCHETCSSGISPQNVGDINRNESGFHCFEQCDSCLSTKSKRGEMPISSSDHQRGIGIGSNRDAGSSLEDSHATKLASLPTNSGYFETTHCGDRHCYDVDWNNIHDLDDAGRQSNSPDWSLCFVPPDKWPSTSTLEFEGTSPHGKPQICISSGFDHQFPQQGGRENFGSAHIQNFRSNPSCEPNFGMQIHSQRRPHSSGPPRVLHRRSSSPVKTPICPESSALSQLGPVQLGPLCQSCQDGELSANALATSGLPSPASGFVTNPPLSSGCVAPLGPKEISSPHNSATFSKLSSSSSGFVTTVPRSRFSWKELKRLGANSASTKFSLPIHVKTRSRVNMEKLLGILPQPYYSLAVEMLRCFDVFLQVAKESSCPLGTKQEALLSLEDIEKLLEFCVIAETSPEKVLAYCTAFSVDEIEKCRRRFILWPLFWNQWLSEHPELKCRPFFLYPQQIVDQILDGNFSLSVDYMSFYYQFPLDEKFQNLFCFVSHNKTYRMLVWPMGLSNVVALAQNFSLGIAQYCCIRTGLRNISVACVIDNTRFVGKREDLCVIASEFLSTCEFINLVINDVSSEEELLLRISANDEFYGISWDFSAKSICLGEKALHRLQDILGELRNSDLLSSTSGFVTNAAAVSCDSWSVHDFIVAFSRMLWYSFVLGYELRKVFYVFKQLRRRLHWLSLRFGSSLSRKHLLEQPLKIWASTKRAMLDWALCLSKNLPRKISRLGRPNLWVFSDASFLGAGIVISNGFSWVSYGFRWTESELQIAKRNINVLEGMALEKVFYSEYMLVRLSRCRVCIVIDNTSLLSNLRRPTPSSKFLFNEIVRRIMEQVRKFHIQIVDIRYVKSAGNPSDIPSRVFDNFQQYAQDLERLLLNFFTSSN